MDQEEMTPGSCSFPNKVSILVDYASRQKLYKLICRLRHVGGAADTPTLGASI